MAKPKPGKRAARLLQQDYDMVPVGKLTPHPQNPNKGASELIADSIDVNGFYGAVVAQRSTGHVLAGNHRLAQLREAGAELVPVIWVDVDDEHALRILLADNETTRAGGYDRAQLVELLRSMATSPAGLRGTGFTQAALAKLAAAMTDRPETPSLADRFVVPPFTTLDARQGYWAERKRQWLAIGFSSGQGRGAGGEAATSDGITYREGHEPPHVYEAKNALEKQLGRTLTWPEFYDMAPELAAGHKDSIFDPVLAELALRWFCPAGGTVLDPFAGGVVRGLVAGALGYDYVGVDLRPEQVAVNVQQWTDAQLPGRTPTWHVGDSVDVVPSLDVAADLVLSCPPYGDLEQYSDLPADLSNMDHEHFLQVYGDIIRSSCAKLKQDRFAVWVVADFRAPDGCLRDFVGATVDAFRRAGLRLYNQATYVTPIGSFAMRGGRQFSASRKLVKVHQDVLVFVKGDPKKAVAACGQVRTSMPGAVDDDEPEPVAPQGTVPVKISAASARQPFHGCEPEYIRNVCRASCCQSSTSPTGTMITVHPSETARMQRLGATVVDGMLQPRPGEKRCPFKTDAHLCGLHGTPNKPFGCIASPFTLNTSDTLVVRNRYRMLKCYKDGDVPAYRAFHASLVLLFGAEEAQRISDHLDAGGGDLIANMPRQNRDMLRENDQLKAKA